MKKVLSKLRWLNNKYLLTAIAFLVWMLFFDANDISLQRRRGNELKRLQKSQKELQEQISETKTELYLLQTNPTTIERYAREKYLMKKDNEDLYIIK